MTLTNRQVSYGSTALILAPVFNFDCEEPRIQLSDGLSIRTMHDEEISAIRKHEKVFRVLPSRAIEQLKFTIDCATKETSSLVLFARHDNAIERINLVNAAFRIWGGVIVPSFLRIEVSNVLYVMPIGRQPGESILDSISLQTITLRSLAPIAQGEMHRFSKADAESLGQLVRSMEKANYGDMKVAFQRLRMFSDEAWPESVIDAMIALEALYCTRSDREKGRPIAERAAELIGRDLGEKTFIKEFLVEAYKLRNDIVHGEDVNPDHWDKLARSAFENDLKSDSDVKLFVSEIEKLPPAAAIEALGTYLCRSIQARLDNSAERSS